MCYIYIAVVPYDYNRSSSSYAMYILRYIVQSQPRMCGCNAMLTLCLDELLLTDYITLPCLLSQANCTKRESNGSCLRFDQKELCEVKVSGYFDVGESA